MGKLNRKYVEIARASSASSPEGLDLDRQIAELKAYAERKEMKLVEPVKVVGSSGDPKCVRATDELVLRYARFSKADGSTPLSNCRADTNPSKSRKVAQSQLATVRAETVSETQRRRRPAK